MEGKPTESSIPEADYLRTREKAEAFYKSIGSVNCPFLKTTIVFNSKGFEHLNFKGRGRARTRVEQHARLRLLRLAPEVLQKSHTLQGVWTTHLWEAQKRHGVWEKRLRPVAYYEFVAVFERVRVKVIIKHVEGEQPHFWSLIPYWRMNDNTQQRRLHDGDPERD